MIPAKQRDDFSNYLRSKCMVVRRSSHEVAREPGARWLLVETQGGWVRAYRVSDERARRQRQINTILYYLRSKPFYGAGAYCVIRWKVDPQPGPNSWQRRRYDPRLRRYVDVQ